MVAQRFLKSQLKLPAGREPDSERIRNRLRNVSRVLNGREVDVRDVVGRLALHNLGDEQSQPGLANTTWAGQRDDPGVRIANQPERSIDFAISPDERRDGGRNWRREPPGIVSVGGVRRRSRVKIRRVAHAK